MRWRRTSTAPARRSASSPASVTSRDPKYHEHWVRLEELKKHGFLNAEMSSTELYPGIDLIVAGKVATGSVDRRAHARGQQDERRPDRRHGDARLRQGQAGRKADHGLPGLGMLGQTGEPGGGGGIPRISAIARAAEGFCTRRPAGSRPTPTSTPRSSPTRPCAPCGRAWDRRREHPLSRQRGAGPVLRAGAAARRRSRSCRARSPASRRASSPPRSPRSGATSIRTSWTTTRSGRADLAG